MNFLIPSPVTHPGSYSVSPHVLEARFGSAGGSRYGMRTQIQEKPFCCSCREWMQQVQDKTLSTPPMCLYLSWQRYQWSSPVLCVLSCSSRSPSCSSRSLCGVMERIRWGDRPTPEQTAFPCCKPDRFPGWGSLFSHQDYAGTEAG